MTLSESDLERWGERIGREVDVPVFLALSGPLGAGKSVLARAVARGAGVTATMPSPTFNLVFTYPSGREVPGTSGETVPVVHADLYRIQDPSELWELGWEQLGGAFEIILVEWPERAGSLLPPDRWEIRIVAASPGSAFREVSVERFGQPPHLPGFPVSLGEEGAT